MRRQPKTVVKMITKIFDEISCYPKGFFDSLTREQKREVLRMLTEIRDKFTIWITLMTKEGGS